MLVAHGTFLFFFLLLNYKIWCTYMFKVHQSHKTESKLKVPIHATALPKAFSED